jgi:L-aminopeptidase/D-esterase-like protein
MTSSITSIPGISVGHAQDRAALTGCTVILLEPGAVCGVEVRGGAPGTRETDLLQPGSLVGTVDAILLTGGSAFGLDAAAGVMRWLEERGRGHPTPAGRVPIVPAAVIFDLGVGAANVRPDASMGYAACAAAAPSLPAQGSAGAGTGATVGKNRGMAHAMPGGIGTAALTIGEDIIVGALVVVNAFGDVIDPGGAIRAGARADAGSAAGAPPGIFADSRQLLYALAGQDTAPPPAENTVIGVVATNAALDKAQANRVARIAHNGIARAIRPAHTLFDGDTLFALATCQRAAPATPLDVSAIGEAAAEMVAQAIVNAVQFTLPEGGAGTLRGGSQR